MQRFNDYKKKNYVLCRHVASQCNFEDDVESKFFSIDELNLARLSLADKDEIKSHRGNKKVYSLFHEVSDNNEKSGMLIDINFCKKDVASFKRSKSEDMNDDNLHLVKRIKGVTEQSSCTNHYNSNRIKFNSPFMPTYKIVSENLNEFLQKKNLKIIKIAPDGHCLINSVRKSIRELGWNGKKLSLTSFQSLCVDELDCYPERYINYVSLNAQIDNELVLEQRKMQILKSSLRKYFILKTWNNDFCDLMVPLLANALGLFINVYQPSVSSNSFSLYSFGDEHLKNHVSVVLAHCHYDSIIKKPNS